ncbi:MAG TPA: hypothetical protein VLI43_14640 [Gemmatimonadaceae bacterium]|nr:hypothetical protein [Gemmatimonadaceae bacterium]
MAASILEQLQTALVGTLTPAWLKIDPMLAGLRGNARFDKLVAGA